MNIFLDTNILFADPLLNTFIGELLIKKAEQKELKIYISRITYDELIRNVSIDIKSKLDRISNDMINFTDKFGLEEVGIPYNSIEVIKNL